MTHLYILQNENGRYYVGSTTNLSRRLRHHMGGHTPSTKGYGSIKLVFHQKYETLSEARRVESWIKKMKRQDYIERIVKDGYIRHKPE